MSRIFAERLKGIRKSNRVNQKELSLFLSVAQNTVSNWEIARAEPDMDALSKIAKRFNVTSDYLIGVTDTMNPLPSVDEELVNKLEQLSPTIRESIINIVYEFTKKPSK